MRFLWFSMLCLIPALNMAQSTRVLSPDGKIELIFGVGDGVPVYEVFFSGERVIGRSACYINISGISDSAQVFEQTASAGIRSADYCWKTLYGQFSEIRDCYNETEIPLICKAKSDYKFHLIFRVYNDGFALRYYFPEQEILNRFEIDREVTEFRFLSNPDVWWIPDDGGFYEHLFRKTSLSNMPLAFTPLTLSFGDSLYMAIHQAALYDYASMSLGPSTSGVLVSRLAPLPDGILVKTAAPRYTPWRYVLISDNPGDIVTSQMILNLNDSCKQEAYSWVRPMKFAGIFWGMHTGKWTWRTGPLHGANTANVKRYIDFAASEGIEGLLIEGWNPGWETWAVSDSSVQDFTRPAPDLNMVEVVAYAASKGVHIIGHHETGGNIPLYEAQMSRAFRYYDSLGIHSVKTGYAGTVIPGGMHRHCQWMVNHYQRVVDSAAKYRIMINSHEPIMPTGLSRTYPNWMTWEAVRGLEWCNIESPPPSHFTTLPYTRALAGPFDFTPGILKLKYDSDKPWRRVNATLANQTALYVIYYSPMQMVADLPENLSGSRVWPFVKDVPVSWDETRMIHGRIGEYTVMARRHQHKWYLGAITNEMPRILDIPLSFLENGKTYLAILYSDTTGTDWERNPEKTGIEILHVNSSDTLLVCLAGAGGMAAVISPVSEQVRKMQSIDEVNQRHLGYWYEFAKTRHFGEKDTLYHLAKGANISYSTLYSPVYSASGKGGLSDGVCGSANYRDGCWQGWQGTNVEFLADLGKCVIPGVLRIRFLQFTPDWIFIPSKVEVFVSADGNKFRRAGRFIHRTRKSETEGEIVDFKIPVKNEAIRYIRVRAENPGPNPMWHHAPGGETWIFCDEIIAE